MTFKEDVNKNIEKVDRKIDEMSIAYLSIKYAKRDKTIWFIVWLITFLALLGSIGYILYLHNDIDTIETDEINISDVESIDNSHIRIGDDIWEKSQLEEQ